MGENSGISWTDHTFNPWMGCTKVSPACANCYAKRDMDDRYGKVKWGDGGTRVKTSAANWKKPLQWNRAYERELNAWNGFAEEMGGEQKLFDQGLVKPRRPRVFCASLADVFEAWSGPIRDSGGSDIICRPYLQSENTPEFWLSEAPESLASDPQGWRPITMHDLRRELFKLIDATPHLDWLLLTKRPENISRFWIDNNLNTAAELWGKPGGHDALKYRSNVWLGTSVENQHYADARIPELLKCGELSPVLFLSCEPMVGQINLPGDVHCPHCEEGSPDSETGIVECYTCDGTGVRNDQLEFKFNWVITGGESGPAARPADPEWFRSLRDQCATAGVPFHFKQWGEFDEHQVRVGKKAAGRLLDGVLHDAFPNVQEVST